MVKLFSGAYHRKCGATISPTRRLALWGHNEATFCGSEGKKVQEKLVREMEKLGADAPPKMKREQTMRG